MSHKTKEIKMMKNKKTKYDTSHTKKNFFDKTLG